MRKWIFLLIISLMPVAVGAQQMNKSLAGTYQLAGQERQPKVDVVHSTDIQPDDYFILCSDGMLEEMVRMGTKQRGD